MGMLKVLVALSMIYMHIIDDYTLQGILANFKQKQWWIDNVPDEKGLYKHDWAISLFMHSFSWTFSIMIPVYVYTIYTKQPITVVAILITTAINILVHAVTDDLKANRKKINLVQDQCIHLIQILTTWLILIML